MRKPILVAIALTALLSTSAVAQESDASYTLSEAEIADKIAYDEFRVEQMQELVQSVEPEVVEALLETHMRDKTKKVVHYEDNFVFVEYSSPEGEIFTWFPGEVEPVVGTWEIVDEAGDLGPVACPILANLGRNPSR